MSQTPYAVALYISGALTYRNEKGKTPKYLLWSRRFLRYAKAARAQGERLVANFWASGAWELHELARGR